MKNVLMLILFVTNVCLAQKQINYYGFDFALHNPKISELNGTWEINPLIANKEVREYILSPQNPKDRFNYGNNISINPDGTLASAYSAPCGNDCFTSTSGKFKMIDEHYMCFFLEMVSHNGDCSGYSEPKEDLGVFRIYKEESKIKLIKSDGNPQNDKNNIQYIDMLIAKDQEISNCANIRNLLSWSNSERLNGLNEIVDFCMVQNQIKDYEILYDKNFERTNLILVKIQNKFRYIIYEAIDSNNFNVTLYNDDFFENAENLIDKIDNDKSLRKETINDEYESWRNSFSKNTIIIFKKKDEIQKIIYNLYNRENKYFKETFYLKDNKPNSIKIETPNGEHVCFYVFDSGNMNGAVIKPTVQNWSFSGVMQYYHQFMQVVEKHEMNK